jgi:hypothetical protein
MSRTFRSIRKEGIEFQVPHRLADLIREQTRGRRSLSVVGTEILARGLGLDPAEFGIDQPVTTETPSSSI